MHYEILIVTWSFFIPSALWRANWGGTRLPSSSATFCQAFLCRSDVSSTTTPSYSMTTCKGSSYYSTSSRGRKQGWIGKHPAKKSIELNDIYGQRVERASLWTKSQKERSLQYLSFLDNKALPMRCNIRFNETRHKCYPIKNLPQTSQCPFFQNAVEDYEAVGHLPGFQHPSAVAAELLLLNGALLLEQVSEQLQSIDLLICCLMSSRHDSASW